VPGLQSPTVRRRRLGQELRELRDAAGLTIEEVAQRLEVSPAKISRIETGRVGVRPRDVSDLLDQYDIQGTHRDNLLTLTREARQQGWWHSYSDVLSDKIEVWVELETEAKAIRLYEVQLIPGLLQTSEYARAVLRAHYRSEQSPEQIEQRVKFRMARQQLVIEQNNTPIWAVLDEAVLRRQMGSPETMQSQYRRLLEFSEEYNITIQVLPFDAGVYSGVPAGFSIMQLAPDPEVVVIEYRGGILYLERSEEVAAYTHVFDRIRATAKGPEESISYISHIANELNVE
jgi:transcriptional regulator with XRE-family HTH domain